MFRSGDQPQITLLWFLNEIMGHPHSDGGPEILDVPNLMKDVPNLMKDVPNFVKDVPRVRKCVLNWGSTPNHFVMGF